MKEVMESIRKFMEETRELFVKVYTLEDWEKVNIILEKYKFKEYADCSKHTFLSRYIYTTVEIFESLLAEIYEAAPDCLLMASNSQYHSSSEYHGYEVYLKCPDKNYGRKKEIYNRQLTAYLEDVKKPQHCLEWIDKTFSIDDSEIDAIYDIFEKKRPSKKTSVSFEHWLIKRPTKKGKSSKNSKNICRFCIICKDKYTFTLMKKAIAELHEDGNKILENATCSNSKNMIYFMDADSDLYDAIYGICEDMAFYIYDSESTEDDYFVDELNGKEFICNLQNNFIMILDAFEIYSNNGYISEEGHAQCIFSEELKELSWDCYTYDVELSYSAKDNFNLNITDIESFINKYEFYLTDEEKENFSKFQIK